MAIDDATILCSRKDVPRLPVELLRNVFEMAADAAVYTSMADLAAYTRVSKTVRCWLAETFYRTVHVDANDRWGAFMATAKAHGSLPVLNLSVVGFQPRAEDFIAVLKILPKLRNVQIPLCLVPALGAADIPGITRLFISKHGPPTAEPLAPGLCTHVTHVFYEPFYTGLYPPEMRAALPTAFPAVTHFGILYLAAAGDAVLRDLMVLARDLLTGDRLQRFYVRVYASEQNNALNDAREIAEHIAAAPLADSRIFVGAASLTEWMWKPGHTGNCTPRSMLWGADAQKWFDIWGHGRPVRVAREEEDVL